MCMKNGKTLHISCLLREKKGEKLFILSLDAWPESNQFPVSHTRDRFPNVWNVISSSRQWRGSVLSLPHPARGIAEVLHSGWRQHENDRSYTTVCPHHCVLCQCSHHCLCSGSSVTITRRVCELKHKRWCSYSGWPAVDSTITSKYLPSSHTNSSTEGGREGKDTKVDILLVLIY